MKRVLLTGATGFIGRHCLPLLLDRGYEVHAVHSKSPPVDGLDVQWHNLDLLDTSRISKTVAAVRPTHLLHFAWHLVPGKYSNVNENLLWIQASIDLMRAFHETAGERLVMAGSCFEYDWSSGFCSEYRTPREPATFYGACKHALQNVLQGYSSEMSLSSAWGRVFFVYGPFEHPNRLVSSVIRNLLMNQPAPCTHGNQIRDYLHVDDVARAFVTLLDSDVQGPVNVASGRPVALREIVSTIGSKLDRQHLIQLGALPSPTDEAPLVFGDVRRLTDEVGWQPRFCVESGLDQTIEWWQTRMREEEKLAI
jgi:nucleoside-diphosphate-sugar epimerase